jgi:hypothetical protein
MMTSDIQRRVATIADLVEGLKKTMSVAVGDDYKIIYEKYFQMITDNAQQIAQQLDDNPNIEETKTEFTEFELDALKKKCYNEGYQEGWRVEALKHSNR